MPDATDSATDKKVQAYMLAALDRMVFGKNQAVDALRRIDAHMRIHRPELSLAVQLLAARRYLRKEETDRADIEATWSWSDAELAAQKRIEPTRTLYAEAAKAQANFRKHNPGCRLAVTPLRSLEKQVALWGTNTTVHAAGKGLLETARATLSSYPDRLEPVFAIKFKVWLQQRGVAPEPTSAAPGTSDHGRGTAVDFVVYKGGREAAGINSASITAVWKIGGWEAKLIRACQGTRLRGPLPHPYEPWHWWLATS